jgi:hypothetical protein
VHVCMLVQGAGAGAGEFQVPSYPTAQPNTM